MWPLLAVGTKKKSCLNTLLVKGNDNFNWIKKYFFIRVTAYKNGTFSSVFICRMSNMSIAWKLKADFCFSSVGLFFLWFFQMFLHTPFCCHHLFLMKSFYRMHLDETGQVMTKSHNLIVWGWEHVALTFFFFFYCICSLKVCSSMTHLMLSMKAGLWKLIKTYLNSYLQTWNKGAVIRCKFGELLWLLPNKQK